MPEDKCPTCGKGKGTKMFWPTYLTLCWIGGFIVTALWKVLDPAIVVVIMIFTAVGLAVLADRMVGGK